MSSHSSPASVPVPVPVPVPLPLPLPLPVPVRLRLRLRPQLPFPFPSPPPALGWTARPFARPSAPSPAPSSHAPPSPSSPPSTRGSSEVWPSVPDATRVLARFKSMPETEQLKKIMNQEGFLCQCVAKLQKQLRKQERENREHETTLLMFEELAGRSLHVEVPGFG